MPSTGLVGCIDASAYPLPDGSWKMWYKNEAKDPLLLFRKEYWFDSLEDIGQVKPASAKHPSFLLEECLLMVTDPTYEEYTGLDVFRSTDAHIGCLIRLYWIIRLLARWHRCRETSRCAVDGKAYIFILHTLEGISGLGKEDPDANRYRYRRSPLVQNWNWSKGDNPDRNKYAFCWRATEFFHTFND